MAQEPEPGQRNRSSLTLPEIRSFASEAQLAELFRESEDKDEEMTVGEFPDMGVHVVKCGSELALDGDEFHVKMIKRYLAALQVGKTLHGTESRMQFKFN